MTFFGQKHSSSFRLSVVICPLGPKNGGSLDRPLTRRVSVDCALIVGRNAQKLALQGEDFFSSATRVSISKSFSSAAHAASGRSEAPGQKATALRKGSFLWLHVSPSFMISFLLICCAAVKLGPEAHSKAKPYPENTERH